MSTLLGCLIDYVLGPTGIRSCHRERVHAGNALLQINSVMEALVMWRMMDAL